MYDTASHSLLLYRNLNNVSEIRHRGSVRDFHKLVFGLADAFEHHLTDKLGHFHSQSV
jgi:hypothetical protein